MRKYMGPLLLLVILGARLHGEELLSVKLNGDRFEVGSKRYSYYNGWILSQMLLDDTLVISCGSMFDLGKGSLGPYFFPDKQETLTPDSVTWTATVVDERGGVTPLGTFTAKMTLQQDGLIRVREALKLNPGVKSAAPAYFTINTQKSKIPWNGSYTSGDKTIEFGDKSLSIPRQPGLAFTFFPQNPSRIFRVVPLSYGSVSLVPAEGLFTLFYDAEGVVEFLLDLRGETTLVRSEDYYGNIDFQKVDGLHLPEYRKSHNLVPNPSFEEGLKYYNHRTYGSYSMPKDYPTYSISDTEHFEGNRSLKILAGPYDEFQLPLGSFSIPVTPQGAYTLSFYAKTNVPGDVVLNVGGRAFSPYLFDDRKNVTLALTAEWQRYHMAFHPPDEFLTFFLDAWCKDGTAAPAEIYIDAIQLEPGELTSFTQTPVQTFLTSTVPGNCIDVGADANFALNVHAQADTAGEIALTVRDFDRKVVYSEVIPFRTDAEGRFVRSLPQLEQQLDREGRTGIFVIETVSRLAGAVDSYREFDRFSIIRELNNTHKYKNIFNLCSIYGNILSADDMDLRLERTMKAGFGSIVYTNAPDPEVEKAVFAKMDEYGFAPVGSHAMEKLKDNGIFEEGDLALGNIGAITRPTPEQLQTIETICERKARNRPWVKVWYFAGEIEALKPFIDSPEAVGQVVYAMYRGLKKGNPDALVHTGGAPYNIGPGGIEWMRNYLTALNQATGDLRFDGTAIHDYQEAPERPDLDVALADYIAMLERVGYADKPIYLDEGGNYFEYAIPTRGMTPHFGNSGNEWYGGMLTYDLGCAERMATAYTVRNYLIVLKYARRIACQNDFGHRRNFWDANCTLGAKLTAINALANLLGSAEFQRDLTFAPEIKSYLFLDAQEHPVVAVWNHNLRIDRGEAEPPVFRFDSGAHRYRVLDIMGRIVKTVEPGSHADLPIGSYPVYIVGETGTLEALAAMVSGATNTGDRSVPMSVNAWPECNGGMTVELTSASAATPAVTMQTSVNGTVLPKRTLQLSPGGAATERFELPGKESGLRRFQVEIALAAAGFAEKTCAISGLYTLLNPVAAVDWSQVTPMPLAAGCTVQAAVSKNTLYLQVVLPAGYESDTLGMAFNPAVTPGNWTQPRRAWEDLFVFEVQALDTAHPRIYVHNVPEVQMMSLAGTPKKGRIDDRISLTRTADPGGGCRIVIGIPAASIMPLSLAGGSKFGWNVFVARGQDVTASMAPIREYRTIRDSGEINFVLGLIR